VINQIINRRIQSILKAVPLTIRQLFGDMWQSLLAVVTGDLTGIVLMGDFR